MLGLTVYGAAPEHIVPMARHAELLGFGGVWVGEHIVKPVKIDSEHPYEVDKDRPLDGTSSRMMYDMWLTVGAILAATSTLKVTTGIYILPLRHPLFTARACISAQQVSGGRFRLGVGSGWFAEEFEALGVPFAERGKRYNEILGVLPKLFAGGTVENPGPFFPFGPVEMTSTPVQVPIIFGGVAPAALKRAAAMGDGWYSPMLPDDQTLETKKKLDQMRSELGRAHLPFSYDVRLQGQPDRRAVDSLFEAGFENVILPLWSIQHSDSTELPLDDKLRALDAMAKSLGLT